MINKFGEKLRELREDNNLTQKELAKHLHLSRSTIAYYESGHRCPDIEKLILIADFFKVSVDYLLDRNDSQYILKFKKDEFNIIELFFALDRIQQDKVIRYINNFQNNYYANMFVADWERNRRNKSQNTKMKNFKRNEYDKKNNKNRPNGTK